MVNWYKGKTFVFKLKDADVKIDFSVWKGWKYRGEKDDSFAQYFPSGQVKFPVKGATDVLKGNNGVVYTLEQVQTMKKKDFENLFPLLNRMYKHVRTVLIGGLEYNYAFGTTINNKIKDAISFNAGAIPKSYLKQTNFPNEAPAKMYDLKVVQDDEAKRWEEENLKPEETIAITGQSKSDSSIQKEQIAIEMPSIAQGDMSQFEISFLDQLKALPNKMSKEQFSKAFIATAAKYGEVQKYTSKNVNVNERADWIFDNKYNQ